jgi:CheY-like chemotaxis protein
MITASVAIALLAGVTSIAIAVASMATWQARIARSGADRMRVDSIELARTVTSDRRVANELAHGLNNLVTAIDGHGALLIANLDPAGTGMREAREIRQAAVSAAQLATQLCTLTGSHLAELTPSPTAATVQAFPDPPPAARVLVVEDEPGMREFIRLVLMRAGYDVLAVASPRGALDVLRRQKGIALILVDIVMPEMDGYEVAAEAQKVLPGIRIVFVSAFAPDPTQTGGDGFLAKPFTSESLTGTVQKALSH